MRRHILIALGLLCAFASTSVAQTPEEKGLSIAQEASRVLDGFVDYTVRATMTNTSRQGQKATRELSIRTLEVANDGDKSLVVFHSPRDVKGTAFLSFSHSFEPDDQWLYLPSLKQIKRISTENVSAPFLASELSYEDMSSREVSKYTYRYLRDEAYGGVNAFVVEAYPEYKSSGYTRQVVWYDKVSYRPLKIEFYDRKNVLLKTMEFTLYGSAANRFQLPQAVKITNHQTGKSTELSFGEYSFSTGLSARDFNKNALKRAR